MEDDVDENRVRDSLLREALWSLLISLMVGEF